MEKNLQKILKIITNAPDKFIEQLSKTEQEVYRKVLSIIKDLDIDSSGNIKPSIANLKKLNEIKMQLSRSLLSKEYIGSVKEYVKQFRTIAALQNSMYTITATNAVTKTLQQIAIDNVLNEYTGKSYSDTVINSIKKVIQTSITSGGSYKDLTLDLEKMILGDGEKQSIIQKQINSQTTVVDAINTYTAEYNKLITDDLNYEWYRYQNSLTTTSREFCVHMVKKDFFHKSEIPTLLTGNIDGHQCKLNKHGMPLGMKEETDINNFQQYRGGYNCKHQIHGVSKEQVPLHLRIKFETAINPKEASSAEYKRLSEHPDYTDVEQNDKGGVKATHKDHTFHPKKGHYEKEAQDILFKNGDIIILENEKGESGKRFSDGYLNGLKADIKAVEGAGKNTIKNKFNDAKSQGAESIILYFPDNKLFSMERINEGYAKFIGQSEYRFREIIFIVNGKVYRYP